MTDTANQPTVALGTVPTCPLCPLCGRTMELESRTAEPGSMVLKERHPGPENNLRSSLPSVPVILEPYRLHFVFFCPERHS